MTQPLPAPIAARLRRRRSGIVARVRRLGNFNVRELAERIAVAHGAPLASVLAPDVHDPAAVAARADLITALFVEHGWATPAIAEVLRFQFNVVARVLDRPAKKGPVR